MYIIYNNSDATERVTIEIPSLTSAEDTLQNMRKRYPEDVWRMGVVLTEYEGEEPVGS